MTDELDLPSLLRAAEHAARAGGTIVAEQFGSTGNARQKAPGDWVSDVDTTSEAAIRARLERAAPSLPVFGEEGGGGRGDVGWFVDPLDGTANFLHGFPAVGVSVALVRLGVPVVGVVHAPLLATTYTAFAGGGALCNGEAITVSGRDTQHAICATGFPFRAKADRLDEYLPVFEAALRRFEDLRRAGAASLDLAWTAAGVFDGYFEQALGTWDVAAGALLVREARGVVTDWSGDERAWLTSGDIIAGPPSIHDEMLRLIRATC
ncbi:MAG TPA: inositol monophosphatase family protein [Acidimicrobiia bacterium]|nr:inositol monophosphatase family protein [Acidimicrobiia bacterium]